MKILHVLSAPRAEGTPRIVLDWLGCENSELIQEVMFIHPEGELASVFKSRPGWQFYNTAFRLKAVNFPRLILLVRKIVKQRKPDIVVCWNTGISPWVTIGAKLGGKVRVISHAGNFPGPKYSIHTLLHTNIAAFTHFVTGSKIICCSKYIRDSYEQVSFTPKGIFKAVYNCISVKNFYAHTVWAQRDTDAIMVATLEKHKDHLTLLNAWKILEDKGANYNLVLVGNGSQRIILEDYAAMLKLNNVSFLGSRNDVNVLLGKAKVFVFSTTIEEGFGTVLIEALASGCLVIASDVPACREVLADGKYGVLIHNNSPDDFALAIEKALGRSRQEDQASINLYLQNFQVSEMISHYLTIAGATN